VCNEGVYRNALQKVGGKLEGFPPCEAMDDLDRVWCG
jgi:hypothetical protein